MVNSISENITVFNIFFDMQIAFLHPNPNAMKLNLQSNFEYRAEANSKYQSLTIKLLTERGHNMKRNVKRHFITL